MEASCLKPEAAVIAAEQLMLAHGKSSSGLVLVQHILQFLVRKGRTCAELAIITRSLIASASPRHFSDLLRKLMSPKLAHRCNAFRMLLSSVVWAVEAYVVSFSARCSGSI